MSRAVWWMAALVCVGCGGATATVGPTRVGAAQLAPASSTERVAALRTFAERAFRTVQTRNASALVFDDHALQRLLHPISVRRARAERDEMRRYAGTPAPGFELLRGATFSGACFQALRDEPVGTVSGLARPGWMFERVLLVGQEPTGRIAFWVEGEFLWTNSGFGALTIQDPEIPRRGHADLELAICDVDLGVHQPLDVVVDGAVGY